MWGNPRFSESLEAIPFPYSFAGCMPAFAGVCGGVAAHGRGVIETGIPATPARRGAHTGWERSKAWMDHVRVGGLAFPRHDFRTVSTYLARMSQMARDLCAIVFLVRLFKGVLPIAGHARDTFGTLTGVPSRR